VRSTAPWPVSDPRSGAEFECSSASYCRPRCCETRAGTPLLAFTDHRVVTIQRGPERRSHRGLSGTLAAARNRGETDPPHNGGTHADGRGKPPDPQLRHQRETSSLPRTADRCPNSGGQTPSNHEHSTTVGLVEVNQPHAVGPRGDQQMTRVHRVQVAEGEQSVVLVDDAGGGSAGNDAAEHTIHASSIAHHRRLLADRSLVGDLADDRPTESRCRRALTVLVGRAALVYGAVRADPSVGHHRCRAGVQPRCRPTVRVRLSAALGQSSQAGETSLTFSATNAT
jgi:hypothetical protein